MDLETAIKESEWWYQAEQMPDRHFDPCAGVSLADHLQAVHDNLRFLRPFKGEREYFSQLRLALVRAGLDLSETADVLATVALLHDIGKTREDKDAEVEDPLTGKSARMRHPMISVVAASELLPDNLYGRDRILALIKEHDTPYSWHMQFQKAGQVPKRRSWSRLDRKIDPNEDGTGLILLSLFKFADIHGHRDVEDVPWFMEQALEPLK